MTEPSDKALKRVTTRLSVVERRLSYIENRLGIDGARATSEANYDKEVRQVVRAEAASAKHVSKSQSSQPQVPEKPVELPLFKIFGAVGFLFIILGLYYLYRWGVEQGFLTYGVRIALGIIAGLSVVAIGEWVRTRKIPQYGELLIGGGLAITYFTVYAAYYFEQVRAALGMNLYVDAVLLFAITALGVWLAFRANSSLLTGFTFFLGYVTAFLLPQGHLSIVSGIILSAGLWIILGAKQWNFGFAPVSAAWMVFFTSVGVLLTSNILAASVYAIIIFALFVTLALRYGKEDDTIVVSIILINSVLALFAGLLIMKQYEALRGVFVFVFAAVHFILWLLCETRRSAAATVYLLLAIAFITIAIPIQLDRSWVTILWAIQGALLVFVGLKYDSLGIRSTGYAVLSIALARFLFFDTWTLSGSERLVTGLFVVIALSMSGYMLQARADLMKKYGRLAPDMVTIVAVASAALLALVESVASNGVMSSLELQWRLLVLALIWGVLSLAALRVSFSTTLGCLRWSSYVLICFILALALFVAPPLTDFGARTIILVAAVVFTAVTANLLRENIASLPKTESGAALTFALLGVGAFTVLLVIEVLDGSGIARMLASSQRQGLLSVLWCAQALALIWVGITRQTSIVRTLGLLLFGVTVLKVLVLDLQGLPTIARVLVTIVIGVLALAASYYYVRHTDSLTEILK